MSIGDWPVAFYISVIKKSKIFYFSPPYRLPPKANFLKSHYGQKAKWTKHANLSGFACGESQISSGLPLLAEASATWLLH